jgi:membrane protein implicated in regulation of membrane protease activity
VPRAWGSLLLGWGLCGYWAVRLLQPALHVPAFFAPPAVGVAALGALGAAALTAQVWARLLPPEESFVTGTVELCGLTGEVTYPVDAARGRVHVYDTHGTLHDVSAIVAPGHPPVARGCRVLVTDYDAARGCVVVEEV